MTLEDLIARPWTWVGPEEVQDPDGVYFVKRIIELPEFFVAGSTVEEVEEEALDALEAYLASYVNRGELPKCSWQFRFVGSGSGAPRNKNLSEVLSLPDLGAVTGSLGAGGDFEALLPVARNCLTGSATVSVEIPRSAQ